MIKHNILNEEQLYAHYDTYQLKVGDKIQTLVRAMIEEANTEGEQGIRIVIGNELIPSSYRAVPAMFARNMKGTTGFPVIQSFKSLDETCIIVKAGHAKAPTTFRARAFARISRGMKFRCDRKDVPSTYRRRPAIFASILSDLTGNPILVRAGKKSITWKPK